MVFSSQKSTTLGKFSFDVSFHKFHVTRPNRAGSNKIYEIRRSKSFFFEIADHFANTNDIQLKIHTNDYHMKKTPISYNSTCSVPNSKYQLSKMLQHFFSHQIVIPRSVQKKYFNLIRSKLLHRYYLLKSRGISDQHRNIRTNTFFNFSYKRYRFHFGIFIPCHHPFIPKTQFHPEQICTVPVPFIMSLNRRGCVAHQKHIQLFKNIKKLSSYNTITANDKRFHAAATFTNWNFNFKKQIFSNRLGISYRTSYEANVSKQFFMFNNRRIYHKRLDNFCSHHQNPKNSRTCKKQKARFERACRSIFNNNHNQRSRPVTPAVDIEDKLIRAKQHRFLFLPSQYIRKPIQHLKFKKNLSPHAEGQYDFPIPRILLEPKRPVTTSDVLIDTPTPDAQPDITFKEGQTWHDQLGFFIPNDLLPFANTDPIYISKNQEKKKGQTWPPGSCYWFDALKKRKADHEVEMTRLAASNSRIEAEKAQHALLEIRANFMNTSVNRLEYREGMTNDLTKFQDHFHGKISTLTDRQNFLHNKIKRGKAVYKTSKQLDQLELELASFNISYSSVIDDNAPWYRYKGDTSDDTKELEYRPHKRPTRMHSSTNDDGPLTSFKKLKSSTPIEEGCKPSSSV